MKNNKSEPIPVMDYRQYRRVRRLVHECCNYIDGNCIALDDGEECVCVQSISYSLLCRWFRAAVLPQDKELETALFHRLNAKKCAVCGALFTPGSNRAKYCPECAARMKRVNAAKRKRKQREKCHASIQWDCSVSCTEKSTSAQYVITYSNVKVSSKTGTLTIQNRNDFEIVVHLLCEGEQEIVSGNIPAGSCYSFANVTDKEYTVGIHADVDAATNIKVIVYDGKDTEPYTN